MVKADANRDYYADLELDPSADANEVKKAFKKLALRYHPDRNPGRELEYNAKFQAIQSANEVLTDPQQRAKYDAQRIRAGLLHTYTGTSPPPARPPVPSRPPATGFSNFPPPPRPPPPPTSKSKFPPQPSGAQNYSNARYNRPETATPWGASGADDTKAKTNDYKAWEQMRPRHGQGPIPPARTVPPKAPKGATFQPGRESSGATSGGTVPRRSGWDRWQDSQAGMTGLGKPTTARPSPNRSKFAPGTPGGDEPQAQASAYFKVSSRDDHPSTSRSQTHMPPPPSPIPTATKPDPLQAFKEQVGINESFGKKKPRAGAQSQSRSAEGLNSNLSPNILHRSATSATPRSSTSRPGFYESRPASGVPSHVRAPSASSNHHSTSPPGKKDIRNREAYSSSSSSASSSENEMQASSSAKSQMPQARKRQLAGSTAAQPPRGFNLYAKVGDEKMAPLANHGRGGYSSIRRHSAVDLTADKPSEGFQEHRMKRDAERLQQPTADSDTPRSPASNGSQPSLARSHSWQEKADHRAKWGSPPKDKDSRPGTGDQGGKTPMYEYQGYNPFSCPPLCGPSYSGTSSSDKWSDQWPFMSPKKPKAATAGGPPYWAIPSSLAPPEGLGTRKRAQTHIASRLGMPKDLKADNDPFSNSFNIPTYTQEAPSGATPLHAQSSGYIDTRFSPDGWHPKFFEASAASHTFTPLREVSPSKGSTAKQQQQQPSINVFNDQEGSSATPSTAVPYPPPRSDKDTYHYPHLDDINFEPKSEQARSPVRANTRKGTRPRGPKLASAQPTVNDVEDEPTASSAAGESLESSKANSDVDAMDIDEPTPLKVDEPDTHGTTPLPNGVTHKPRRAPTLPPRVNGYGQPEVSSARLNLGKLKDVYPFAPSNEGLRNMKDMASDLPFESRASPTKPATDGPLQHLNLPDPPVCPRDPQSLTESSCVRYGKQIGHYIDEWDKFNSKMAGILTAGKTFLHGSPTCDWVDIQDNGYDRYMRGLVELRRARAHYDIACEKHEKSLQNLGPLRQKMKERRGGVPS